jgi:hypothetical protein
VRTASKLGQAPATAAVVVAAASPTEASV